MREAPAIRRGGQVAARKGICVSIFKANDIRGVYPDEIDRNVFVKLGRALYALAGAEKKFLVGGDARGSTKTLKDALIEGLAAEGGDCVDIGLVTTPECSFAKRAWKIPNLAMVTASHNPPRYNGLKILTGERAPTEEVFGEFKGIYDKLPPASTGRPRGACSRRAVRAEYLRWLLDGAPEGRPLKVVFGAGNGPLGAFGPGVLRQLGHETIEVNCAVDGRFPGRDPNSAVEANLKETAAEVIRSGAALALAFDGDGDRISVIDSAGGFITADELANLLLRTGTVGVRGEKVIHDIKCASIVSEAVRDEGGRALVEKSGHAYIRRRMRAENARFGVEVSGHLFYRELAGGDDAMYSALRVLAMASRKPLTALGAELTRGCFITPDIRIEADAETREKAIAELADFHRDKNPTRIDGLRVAFPGGWALVRKSITEPKLTFRFEAESIRELRTLIREFVEPLEPELREKVIREAAKGMKE